MEVDAQRLTHLIQSLGERGLSQDGIDLVLAKCGLTRDDAAPKAKTVEGKKVALFVREACVALDDPLFGAKAGLELEERAFHNLAGYIGKYSKDLRSAVENNARLHNLIDPALAFAMRVSGNSASIELSWKDPSYAIYHRHSEFVLFGLLSRLRTLTQTNFYPIELRFDHEVGSLASKFAKLGGFPVVFGAENPEIVLSLSSLNIPIPTYDLELREHLTAYGNRLLRDLPDRTPHLRSRVEGLIVAALPGQMLSAEEAAASLGMSKRSFSRRLSEDGVSYREIVDDLRYDLAQTFIRDGMNLSEIAFMLGYGDQAAFSAAFKRWSGLAPRDFARGT